MGQAPKPYSFMMTTFSFVGGLGGPEFAVLLVLSVILGFWIWMLVDCCKNEKETTKTVWIIVIVLGGIFGGGVLGPLIYFFGRRVWRRKAR